jgi:hypothetical protein
MEGFGRYFWASDKSVYQGYFVNDFMQGFGVMTYADGRFYKGFFRADKRNGFGIYTFADGSVLAGGWT